MINSLTLSLLITLLGMGLVFGAIAMLWLLMDLLVTFTRERTSSITPQIIEERELKQNAAAIAVAIALAQNENAGIKAFPLPPTAIVSPWQAVMRAKQLKQRGPLR